MGLDLKELSRLGGYAQQQILAKLSSDAAAPMKRASGKYHAEPDGRAAGKRDIRFDSRAEARRYDELLLLQQAGEISALHVHERFTLQRAYTDAETGARIRSIGYEADFTYRDRTGVLVIEDVKGGAATKTALYKAKKKLMQSVHGIEIQEING